MASESGADELCAATMGRPRSPDKGGPRGGTSWGIPAAARDVGCLTFAGTGQKAYRNQRRGRGGIGRRKGLKIPRWQRRVGSTPTARTKTGLPARGTPQLTSRKPRKCSNAEAYGDER